MVTTMDHLMATSHKEGLAATMILLAFKVVMGPILAASLLLYLIIISKLILSIVNMIKTIISLINQALLCKQFCVELTGKPNVQNIYFNYYQHLQFRRASVHSRFVRTVVVEKRKTCVEFNYSRINSYNNNLKSKSIELDNTNSRKQKSWMNNKFTKPNFPYYSTSCVAIFFVVVNSLIL